MTTSTAVTVADRNVIAAYLDEQAEKFRVFLPKGVEPANVIALARMEITEKPELAECTKQSILMSVARICSWGAEIGREAFLVPINVKVKPKDGSAEYWENAIRPSRATSGSAISSSRRAGRAPFRATSSMPMMSSNARRARIPSFATSTCPRKARRAAR